MAADISKAGIAGPCRITFKGIDLGHTLDGVDFTAERDLADVIVDKAGNTPIDKILTGNRAMVTFKLAQTQWDQLNAAMPETSSYDGAALRDRTDLGADAGYSLRQDAGVLVIHPLKNAGDDYSEDITFYKAVSVENVELPYKVNEQKVVQVTMQALYVEDYGTGRRLGHIGPADVS